MATNLDFDTEQFAKSTMNWISNDNLFSKQKLPYLLYRTITLRVEFQRRTYFQKVPGTLTTVLNTNTWSWISNDKFFQKAPRTLNTTQNTAFL